jgi:hypothetical protein
MTDTNNQHLHNNHWIATPAGVHHISAPVATKEPGCVWLALFYLAIGAGIIALALIGHAILIYYIGLP